MKNRIFQVSLIICILLVFTTPVFAQTYAFSLETEIVHVMWQSDGTLALSYEFTFTNAINASPIDYVDVGMPTNSYSLGNITADLNGQTITHIAYSSYVDGIEVGLGSNAIQPGHTGTVRVQIFGIENVLYEDSTDSNYASAVFSPTWFGSEFIIGPTDLTVIYHLPLGVQPNEPRYHQAPDGFPQEPVTGLDNEGRVTYIWRNQTANAYTQYLFGASFPASYVPASAITTPSIWQRLGIDPEAILGFAIICGVMSFIVGIPVLSVIGAQRRKLKYLPPRIAISGHGIKRGLTAIEAAVILEQPMDKILTMILFAVIKKGAATVKSQKPLELEVTDPLPKDLRAYEVSFLEAMKIDAKAKRRKEMQEAMIKLVRSVSKKMKGFSVRETRRYYEDIMEKAWAQVEAADTPEVRSEKYDEVMEWTMLDKDYGDRTRDVFQNRPVFIPYWWGRYDPGYSGPTIPKTSAPASRPTPGGSGLPHLPGSDFAASVVTGAQNFAAGVIGSVSDFTSGVTKTTNPPPKPSSSSYRSSGGGSSCACACACAGCACACAGGGR